MPAHRASMHQFLDPRSALIGRPADCSAPLRAWMPCRDALSVSWVCLVVLLTGILSVVLGVVMAKAGLRERKAQDRYQ